MPRIRTIKPTFWSDEKVCALTRPARLTLVGLISVGADDEGRAKANPRVVRAAVYPLDDDIPSTEVAAHLDEIERVGIIRRYEVNGERYLVVVHWHKHQKIDKPSKSQLPPPPAGFVDHSTNPPRALADSSRRSGAGEGEEVEREMERERSGAGIDLDRESARGAQPAPGSSEPPAPAPPAVARTGDAAPDLPAGALAWLDAFYPDSHGERAKKREELEHLLNGGTKYRRKVLQATPARLDVECRLMVRDRKAEWRNPMALLLKKLDEDAETNLAGRTVTEQASHDDRATSRSLDAYQRFAKRRVGEWMSEHEDEARKITDAIDAEIRAQGGDPTSDLGRKFRDSAVITRCREAAGVPSFEAWRAPPLAGAGSG